jgi:hypothetical protein
MKAPGPTGRRSNRASSRPSSTSAATQAAKLLIHYGRAELVQAARADVLTAAYQRHPERFVRKHPKPRPIPEAAWINHPAEINNRAETRLTQ